jgi:hypothetical protein
MVSLVDIVPQTRVVDIAGGELQLRGLGLRHIADLLVRYPELRKLWVNGAPAADIETLIEAAPGAIGSIIATAADQPEAADHIADALSLEDVAECLIAIRELTMPGGANPFAGKLARLLGAEQEAEDQDDSHQSGRAADTNMPLSPSS